LSSSDNSLKIPIEIKTEDLDEIRELINEISKAESDLRSLKATPQKGKGTGDTSSRSAFTRPDNIDERGGIFGRTNGPATPTTAKDKKSSTPFQRESEFAKLQNQVKEQGGQVDKLQESFGDASQAIGLASTFSGGGIEALTNVGKLATKAFLPLALITTIVGFVKSTLDTMLAPGGRLDRRFRRDYKKESIDVISLRDKQEISFGRRIVRVTTISSQRGSTSQVRSNLDYVKNGVEVFDINGVLNKGIGAGTI